MRKGLSILLISCAFVSSAPTVAMATQTSQPTPSIAASKQVPAPGQKETISAARSIFSLAKSDASNGFDRALADAKALWDQAIASAGNDQVAIKLAKKVYMQSYQAILQAYRTALDNAKMTLINAIAAAKAKK
jgi:hypothetical protein